MSLADLRLREELISSFEKYAIAGPKVVHSPSMNDTELAEITSSELQPSPEVLVSRSAALVEPSKQGLSQYDRMMLDLESTLNRTIKQLDKETQDAQESKEKERILKEQLQKRLAKKQAGLDAAIAKGKQVGS